MGDRADLSEDGDGRARSLLGRKSSFTDLIVGLVGNFAAAATASTRGSRAGLGRIAVNWLLR